MALCSWAVAGFVLCMMVTKGEAVKCWECFWGETGCSDDFSQDEDFKSVNDDCDYCQKTKVNYASGSHLVERSCYKTDDKGETDLKDEVCSSCSETSSCGANKEICYCKGELCNHGARIIPSTAALVIISVLAKLL